MDPDNFHYKICVLRTVEVNSLFFFLFFFFGSFSLKIVNYFVEAMI